MTWQGLQNGVVHHIRKKELQNSNRRLSKQAAKLPPPLTDAQQQAISEEAHFQTIRSKYMKFTKKPIRNDVNEKMVGKPWEPMDRLRLRELATENTDYDGDRLNPKPLRELSDAIEPERDKFAWLLDNDIELEGGLFDNNDGKNWVRLKRSESEAIKLLIDRLDYA